MIWEGCGDTEGAGEQQEGRNDVNTIHRQENLKTLHRTKQKRLLVPATHKKHLNGAASH